MKIDIGMIKSMATMAGVKFPVAEPPMNPVSEFIDKEINKILPEGADEEIVGIIKGIYINMCNHDPNKALQTLVMVHGDIGELVRKLQMEQYIDAHPPVEIDGPEGEPELDDTIDPVAFIAVGDTEKAEE